MIISDLVTDREADIVDPDRWCGCIDGALTNTDPPKCTVENLTQLASGERLVTSVPRCDQNIIPCWALEDRLAHGSDRRFEFINPRLLRRPARNYMNLGHTPVIALEERDRSEDYHAMILSVSEKLNCSRMIVTRGKRGILAYDRERGFVESPAMAGQVVDRMGTGDAVLSLASLLVVQDAPMEIIGFVGNAVGAQAVATLGHQRSIEPVSLVKFMTALLK